MPIFGQVWLWSSLAFLLGALLCWGLVALPARRRVGELEAELAAQARRQSGGGNPRRPVEDERDEYDPRRLLTGAERERERLDEQNASLTRAYAMSGTRGEASPPPPGIRGALDGSLSAPPETETELSDGPRSSSTQYLNVSGSSSLEAPPEVPAQESDRGWFDDRERQEADSPGATTVLPQVPAEPVDSRLVDDDVDGPDDGGTVFTQRTHPIPGELIRQLDDSHQAPEHLPEHALERSPEHALERSPERLPEHSQEPKSEPAHALAEEPADSLVDDIEDEDDSAERTILAEPIVVGESKHQLVEDPQVTSTLTPTEEPEAEPLGTGPAHGGDDRTEVVPAHTAEDADAAVSDSGRRGAVSDQSTPGAEEPKIMPGVTVQAEPTKNKLPKRVPSKPPRRTPFGVQTTSPATQPASSAPATDEKNANEAPRSLFEPIVPAGDGPAVPPPPHRMRGVANGRGPFGPGSAMPLPGGAAPGPEFTVKASASAMRYCTPESEKFDRTVAEVWFRSAADAERVGFRPAG